MDRKQRNGEVVVLDRYILNYSDPLTRKRKSQFFETRKEAEGEQQRLYKAVGEGSPLDPNQSPTIAEAVQHWLGHCEGRVVPQTIKSYKEVAGRYIVGPALEGPREAKKAYTETKVVPEGTRLVSMLGGLRMAELTTAQIRSWHQTVLKLSTPYMARYSRKLLSTVLALAGEDFGMKVALMPRRLGAEHRKKERVLLKQDHVKAIFEAALIERYGLYYIFLFLTGVRPGEMLGLVWEDLDFDSSVINIRRTQTVKGQIKPFPKTAAGQRVIPMVPLLRKMLLDWKDLCPAREGFPCRVFPALGSKDNGRGGGPMLLSNFRHRLWKPLLRRLGLPPATPYVTRHLVISNLQAQGVEVGIVAKIAGHANPQITLQHYTHQVRENAGVMDKLNTAYGLGQES